MTSPEREALIENAVTETIAKLPQRLASLGAMNVSVTRSNDDKSQIRLTFLGGLGNSLLEMLEDPAVLEFKEVSFGPGVDPATWKPKFELEELLAQFGGELPPDTELFVQRVDRPAGGQLGLLWPLKRVSVVVGNDLLGARQTWDEWGDAAISFALNEEAGRRLEAATRRNLGRPMAIVLVYPDRTEVVSAPMIEGTIGTMGIIRGGFTVADAEELAMKLSWGALPARLRVVHGSEPE